MPQATARPEFVTPSLSYILGGSDVEDDDEGISADTVLAGITKFITHRYHRSGRAPRYARRHSQPMEKSVLSLTNTHIYREVVYVPDLGRKDVTYRGL